MRRIKTVEPISLRILRKILGEKINEMEIEVWKSNIFSTQTLLGTGKWKPVLQLSFSSYLFSSLPVSVFPPVELLPNPLPFYTVIISMAKSILARPDRQPFVLAVWPEERPGLKRLRRRRKEYSFWMRGTFFSKNSKSPLQKVRYRDFTKKRILSWRVLTWWVIMPSESETTI